MCVSADEKSIALASDRIPLTVAFTVDPFVGLWIETKETHGKRCSAADGAVGCSSKAHQVCTFTRVIETEFSPFAGGAVNDKSPVDKVAFDEFAAVWEVLMKEPLVAGDDGFFVLLFVLANSCGSTFVQLIPDIAAADCQSINFPI